MEKDKHIVRPMENTLILSLPATQTEPYLAMCHMNQTCDVMNQKYLSYKYQDFADFPNCNWSMLTQNTSFAYGFKKWKNYKL